jgi:hypothetical protein
MKFDPTYNPNYANLPPAIAERMSAVFYERRAAGLNVQFMNAGKLDEWSFAAAEQRDNLVSRLNASGESFAISK